MKWFVLGAVLLFVSAASLADTPAAGTAPPPTSGTTTGAKAPPGGDAAQQRSAAKTSGNSCRKPAFGTCKGCEITCGAGEKATCGDALYSWNSNKCVRDASCRCKARRS
jgi:hypothetical protein